MSSGDATPIATLAVVGDRALRLRFGDRIDAATCERVARAGRRVLAARLPGVVDAVPAYTTLTIVYDWQRVPDDAGDTPWQWLGERVLALCGAIGAGDGDASDDARQVELPVCYDGAHAPDLAEVAARAGLTPAQVVQRHAGGDYRVAFLGFRPGFPYLLGLDPVLATPRRTTPRVAIAAGSVGIGGAQTGVYPFAGPGGWQLIGRCPLRLFDPSAASPTRLLPGDRLRFVAIDEARFDALARSPEGLDADAQALPDADADAGVPLFAVGRGGVHAGVQDPGRAGQRHLGIAAGGVFDPVAAAFANALVGNPTEAAVLEFAVRGPELHTLSPLRLALLGAGMQARVDGQPLPWARPVDLPAGCTLRFQAEARGARSWLAVAGSVAAPRWFGSAALDTGSGAFGRALAAGDIVYGHPSRAHAEAMHGITAPAWWIEPDEPPDQPVVLRWLADPDADPACIADCAGRTWTVALAADRRGLRLDGKPLAGGDAATVSMATLPGSIQLPADGLPIVLGPDGQTVGGYPLLGHVIEADLGRLAQLKPGDALALLPCSLAEAHAARRRARERDARLQLALAARLRA